MKTENGCFKALADMAIDTVSDVLAKVKNIDLERTTTATAIIAGGLAIAGSNINAWEISQGLVQDIAPNMGKDGVPITNIIDYIANNALQHDSVGQNMMDVGMFSFISPVVAGAIKTIAKHTYDVLPQLKSRNIERFSQRMVEHVQASGDCNSASLKDMVFESYYELTNQMDKRGMDNKDQVEVLNNAYRKLSP